MRTVGCSATETGCGRGGRSWHAGPCPSGWRERRPARQNGAFQAQDITRDALWVPMAEAAPRVAVGCRGLGPNSAPFRMEGGGRELDGFAAATRPVDQPVSPL